MNYREGVKFGIMLSVKTFDSLPFTKAMDGLIETYKKIDKTIDEDGNPIKQSEE